MPARHSFSRKVAYAAFSMAGTIWGLRREQGKVTQSGVLFLLVYEGKSAGRIYELEEIKGE